MAAAVLCDEPCTITNAPRIADVEYILEVLCDLGADAHWIGEHELRIHARQLDWDFIPLEAAKRLRASFVLLGPMLGRTGKVVIPNPAATASGDGRSTSTSRRCAPWAPRSTTSGATTTRSAPNGLRGDGHPPRRGERHRHRKPAHGGGPGRAAGPRSRNAAAEPEVDNLIDFLNAMGGRVQRDPRRRPHDRRRRRRAAARCTARRSR